MKRFNCDFSSRFRILKGGKISLVVSALLASTTVSFAAPTGGVVTSGSATISSSGTTTNIVQSTSKATINWNSFSIASNETVNFNQPNVNSITLNRVIGNERSIIDGALNANGQVWILNSNGILFNSNAKINTAGIIATTKNLSDADFNAGNYKFSGNSSESVINMGEITASDDGYVAMLANTVQNDGTIKAYKGTVHLVGANEATINLNGNSIVSLTVNKGVLDALVENKNIIQADGGKIYLTTNAVDELLRGVVNNTGVIEAKSLDDVSSEVILFAHGGTANISGSIIADGGFVETSGKNLGVADGTIVKAKTWLLDPEYIVIGSKIIDQMYPDDTLETAASTIVASLNNGTDVIVDATDDIQVNESIITGAMANDATLTLKAGDSIIIGAYGCAPVTIDATQNGNTKKLNVFMSVSNLVNGGSFYMNDGSSIKTNGGNVVAGGVLTEGAPSIDGTATYNYGASIYDNVTIDAGAGNITLTAGGSGTSVGVDRATLKGANIYLKAYGSNDLELSGSNIQATQNLAILGANVYIEGREIQDENGDAIGYADTKLKVDEISITSNALAGASDTMVIWGAVINTNDKLTINAAANVDLSGSQINFANTGGTLEINTFNSSDRASYVDAYIEDWEVDDEAALLAAINDDEGTSYASIDEYVANAQNKLPMLVSLKGGTYKSKLFSDGTASTINTSTLGVLNNGLLAFGDGLSSSVNEYGMLKQPFYYDSTDNKWYQLTYGVYDVGDVYHFPLAAVVAIGGSGYADGSIVSTIEDVWGAPATDYVEGAFTNTVIDKTGVSNGAGTIVSTTKVMIDGKELEMKNTYTLSSNTAVISSANELTNKSGSAIDNVRFWVGTNDDYIAGYDWEVTKTRGNLVDGEFVATTAIGDRSDALKVTGGTAGVLFYTNSENSAVFATQYDWDNDEENAYNLYYNGEFYSVAPTSTPLVSENIDAGYGVHASFGTLADGAKGTTGFTYASGSLADLADVIGDAFEGVNEPVVEEPVVEEPVAPTPTIEEQKIEQVIASIINTQQIKVEAPKIEFVQPVFTPAQTPVVSVIQIPTTNLSTGAVNTPLANIALKLGVPAGENVELVSSPISGQQSERITLAEISQIQPNSGGENTQGSNIEVKETRVALGGGSLVELVNGGVNLPEGVEQEFYVVKSSKRGTN